VDIVEFAVLGLAAGALYALLSLGVVLVYRSSGVLNFATGAIGAVGAFVFYGLRDQLGVPTGVALPIGLIAGAAVSALMHVAVLSPMRSASRLAKLIASLGVLTVIQGAIRLGWKNPAQPTSYLPTATWTFFGSIRIGEDRIIIILGVIVLVVILSLVYSKTRFGLATTVVAEKPSVAACAGWSITRIELVNFTLAGALSALAAISIAPITGLNVEVLSLLVIPAIAGALVGRLSSFVMAVVGALGIGILESELSRYTTQQGVPESVPLAVIVVMLIVGGRARVQRGEAASLLPLPGKGRPRLGFLAGATAILVVLIFTLSAPWTSAITFTLIITIAIMSVVVVTGYAGQVSLGQWTIAGFGGWTAAKLASSGVDFALSAVIAVVVTAVLGTIVAIPALRTRGVYLAVITLAVALVLYDLVLTNLNLTGGYNGLHVPAPSLAGIDLDPIRYPDRYGLLVLVIALLVALVVCNIRTGRAGLRLLAVRSNERVAESLGINVYAAKLFAFMVASGIAATAGVLSAFQQPLVILDNFDVFQSMNLVQFAVIGGGASVAGAPVGALSEPGGIVTQVTSSLFSIGDWLTVIGGLLVLFVLVRHPDGVAHAVAGAIARRRGRTRTPAGRRDPGRAQQGRVLPRRDDRSPARLDVEGVSVSFGGVKALQDVNLHVEPGEVLGLIGPNGAGKTTLLDAISGFAASSGGRVVLDGTDISRWSPVRRARAGICRSFQAVELFGELTVRENLIAAADRHDFRSYLAGPFRPGGPFRAEAVEAVIGEFSLEGVLEDRPASLSAGMARLVGIARTIVSEPRVLLLDEPAAGLDASESMTLSPVIRQIAHERGTPVVLIEHDVPLVLSTCDRVVVLDWGRVLASGTPAEIESHPGVRSAYFGVESSEPEEETAASHGSPGL
jgi:ABC-type branched-subunit amino acid transport system ATPase component/ABC-type branched-subunit amino acid transport system permease subunit